MIPDERQHIAELAADFRGRLDRANKALLPVQFRYFPVGACEPTSILLARFLADHGHPGFRVISAPYITNDQPELWYSHVWVGRDDLLVDITADQFNMGFPPVIVERHSDWHAKHETVEVSVEGFAPEQRAELRRVYELLCSTP
ncbi:hypothetical protein [Mesorhizobium sp.]|uniref:hypothetical protein n=1 Tax=Mesorhizobium sp. TaxID=1871066 RepID=UPI000FE63797|nr:hypothetical protein [Mesorhizobium sp.]RWM29790.1 MAG: hypothetical protein EOR75_31935 [Mesorhizobium sp.]TJV47688.1 MAG: hypothetical protein E5Y01_31790 [Mesorhizobium sp.]